MNWQVYITTIGYLHSKMSHKNISITDLFVLKEQWSISIWPNSITHRGRERGLNFNFISLEKFFLYKCNKLFPNTFWVLTFVFILHISRQLHENLMVGFFWRIFSHSKLPSSSRKYIFKTSDLTLHVEYLFEIC